MESDPETNSIQDISSIFDSSLSIIEIMDILIEKAKKETKKAKEMRKKAEEERKKAEDDEKKRLKWEKEMEKRYYEIMEEKNREIIRFHDEIQNWRSPMREYYLDEHRICMDYKYNFMLLRCSLSYYDESQQENVNETPVHTMNKISSHSPFEKSFSKRKRKFKRTTLNKQIFAM